MVQQPKRVKQNNSAHATTTGTKNITKSKSKSKTKRNAVAKKTQKRKRKRIQFNFDKYDPGWLKEIEHPEKTHPLDSGHLVYLIKCTYRAQDIIYVGETNSIRRRWQQHNGLLAGGAKFTTNWVSRGFQWEPIATVSGFKTQNEALSFETRVKHITLSLARGTLAESLCHYKKPPKSNKKKLMKNNIKHDNTLQQATSAAAELHLKVRKLITVLNQDKWAKRWDWAKNTPLVLTWYNAKFRPSLSSISSQGAKKLIAYVPEHVDEQDATQNAQFVEVVQ
jgi:predicted GIY-YIG superfamily endonuclease